MDSMKTGLMIGSFVFIAYGLVMMIRPEAYLKFKVFLYRYTIPRINLEEKIKIDKERYLKMTRFWGALAFICGLNLLFISLST
jgi:hypothetical protein